MDDGSFQTTMKKILLFKKERSGPYWTGFWDGIDLKSYTRNYNNLRYNISQGLGKALPNKIPRNGGGSPKFGPAVESCFLFSLLFFFIFLTLLSLHGIIPPARRQKEMPLVFAARSARVECFRRAFSSQNALVLYLILQRKSRGFCFFSRTF